MLGTISSILIVRLSAIGDVIHTLPALQILRAAFPGVRIGWVVEELGATLLQDHPHVDKLYVIPKKRWRGRYLRLYGPEIRPFFQKICADGWDAAVDFQGITKSGFVAWQSGAPLRVGYAGRNSREVDRLFINKAIRPGPADIHVVQQNCRLLEGLGIQVPDGIPAGHLPVNENDKARVDGELRKAGWQGESLLAVNPGAGFPSKLWGPGNYADLARLICRAGDLRPLIFWGPREEGLRDSLVDYLGDLHPIPAPPTSIRESVAMTALCRLFLGGDTGPSHVAGLLGVPVLTVFGSTDARRNHPWPGSAKPGNVKSIQRDELWCVPCWRKRCPLENEDRMACLRDLTPAEAFFRAEPWLTSVLAPEATT